MIGICTSIRIDVERRRRGGVHGGLAVVDDRHDVAVALEHARPRRAD